MAIERWNGTRYEAVDLSLYGASTIPREARVYADGKWRKVWEKPVPVTPVAPQTTGPHSSMTNNTWTTLRTITVSGTGPATVSASWGFSYYDDPWGIPRGVRVLVDGGVAQEWRTARTGPGWASSGTIDVGLFDGETVEVQALVNSSSNPAARVVSNLTTEIIPLPRVRNPRGEARLWAHFTDSSNVHAGIERPTTTYLGTTAYQNGTLRLSGGRATTPTSGAADIADGMAYTFWMRTLSSGSGNRLVLSQIQSSSSMRFTHNLTSSTAGPFTFSLVNGTTQATFTSTGPTFPRNVWTHVALVWSRDTPESSTTWTCRLFVDGIPRNVFTTGVTFPSSWSLEGYPIIAGGKVGYFDPDWEGDVDDLGYWARPLTGPEVQQIYLMKDQTDLPAT